MAQRWPKVRIDELCERIVDCLNRTAPVVEGPTQYKMIRTTNVRDGWIDLSDVKYVDETAFKKWTRRECPRRGDIVLTREAPLGEVGMIRTDDAVFLGQRTVLYRPDPRKLDGRYLLYALQGYDLQQQIRALGSGATVEHMRVPDAKELMVSLPDLQTQARIGSVLGSLDDLIENNTRRIAILEEIARRIFEEWFVRFRSPGCEDIPLVESRIGPIPEGWRNKTLEALIDDHIGGGWGKDEPDQDHDVPAWVIRGTDIPEVRHSQISSVPYRFHKRSNLRSRQLQTGDIVFEVSGGSKGQPVGRALLLTSELLSEFRGDAVMCASFCKLIRPRAEEYGAELLYLSFRNAYETGEIEQFQVQSTGISNFKWTEYLQKVERAVPPKELRSRFHQTIAPLFSMVSTLGAQAANLRAQRDLLLPKLISGEIDVSRAEWVMEAAE